MLNGNGGYSDRKCGYGHTTRADKAVVSVRAAREREHDELLFMHSRATYDLE